MLRVVLVFVTVVFISLLLWVEKGRNFSKIRVVVPPKFADIIKSEVFSRGASSPAQIWQRCEGSAWTEKCTVFISPEGILFVKVIPRYPVLFVAESDGTVSALSHDLVKFVKGLPAKILVETRIPVLFGEGCEKEAISLLSLVREHIRTGVDQIHCTAFSFELIFSNGVKVIFSRKGDVKKQVEVLAKLVEKSGMNFQVADLSNPEKVIVR